MALLRKKYRSATLVESIVSMILILLFFGMATSLLVQIHKAGPSKKQLKAHELLHQFISFGVNLQEGENEVRVDEEFKVIVEEAEDGPIFGLKKRKITILDNQGNPIAFRYHFTELNE